MTNADGLRLVALVEHALTHKPSLVRNLRILYFANIAHGKSRRHAIVYCWRSIERRKKMMKMMMAKAKRAMANGDQIPSLEQLL